MLEPIKAKSGEKKWRARKSRKREDNDDSTKTIASRRRPKRSNKKRPSQPIPNLICLSGGQDFLFSFTVNATGPPFGEGETCFIINGRRRSTSVERTRDGELNPVPGLLAEPGGREEMAGPSSATMRASNKT
jgi:hypothetical protein